MVVPYAYLATNSEDFWHLSVTVLSGLIPLNARRTSATLFTPVHSSAEATAPGPFRRPKVEDYQDVRLKRSNRVLVHSINVSIQFCHLNSVTVALGGKRIGCGRRYGLGPSWLGALA